MMMVEEQIALLLQDKAALSRIPIERLVALLAANSPRQFLLLSAEYGPETLTKSVKEAA